MSGCEVGQTDTHISHWPRDTNFGNNYNDNKTNHNNKQYLKQFSNKNNIEVGIPVYYLVAFSEFLIEGIKKVITKLATE